jgi:peroxiredoxin
LAADSRGNSTPIDIVARLRRRPLALNERLVIIAQDMRDRDPDGAGVVDRFVARLEAAAMGKDAPKVGEALPPFMMPDHDGHLVSLSDLHADGPLVVVFHRGHWCPYCRMTIATLVENQRQIAPAGIVAISAETQRFTRKIRAEVDAGFAFLSDIDAAYAASIGLAISIDAPLRALFERSGKRVPDFQGTKDWVLPVPAVFVVNRDGLITARHVDPDYRRRMEVDELVDAVERLSG